jgi:general secretion pathway protein E/type IV pilus assembly protein PilB
MELLKMTPALDELIAPRLHPRTEERRRRRRLHSLIDDGLRRVLEGVTTLEEVGRVVDLTERLA